MPVATEAAAQKPSNKGCLSVPEAVFFLIQRIYLAVDSSKKKDHYIAAQTSASDPHEPRSPALKRRAS
jgi:hypothetical protein